MTLGKRYDELRQRAADLARQGAWSDVATLLSDRAGPAAAEVPELVTLRAESFMFTGKPREARDWLSDRIPELARKRERTSLRSCTNMLGVAHFTLGELDDARQTFERALELGDQDDDTLCVARATNNLGAIANVRGAREEALAHYQLAIPAYQNLGNAIGLAQSYHNMAITFRDLNQLSRADECERRAIEFASQAGSRPLVLLARLGRAELSLRSGDAALAEVRARQAARGFRALGDAINEADALRIVGAALTAQSHFTAAHEALDAALAHAQEHGSMLNEAETLRARAELFRVTGKLAHAEEDAREALTLFERLGASPEVDGLREWIAGLNEPA